MLTSKQRAKLRGFANTIQPVTQVGKSGVTPELIKELLGPEKYSRPGSSYPELHRSHGSHCYLLYIAEGNRYPPAVGGRRHDPRLYASE